MVEYVEKENEKNSESQIENETDSDSDEGDENDSNEISDVIESKSEGKEKCNVELRHLLVMNDHELNLSEEATKCAWTIDCEDESSVNEEQLKNKTAEVCSILVSSLFSLPTETLTDVGVLATLPKTTTSLILPRQLPPPKLKAATKWEQFAKERGITKTKRSRKVFDEDLGEWKHRTGYDKANKKENWPIMEVKKNDDPFQDPWEKLRAEKRQRVQKNTLARVANQERRGDLPKGTTSKFRKAIPHGLPVDLKQNKTDSAVTSQKRGKTLVQEAIRAAQHSTASIGKFDAMLEGEPARKQYPKKKLREKLITSNKNNSEKEKSLKLLKNIIVTGGSQRAKDIKKGLLAKGETAYDYEYSDGLGPSTFRKKKGRAGAGKKKKK